VCVEMCIAW